MADVGDRPEAAAITTVDIDHNPANRSGFAVHPCGWGAERVCGWIGRDGRHRKAPEVALASAQAFLYAFSVMFVVRRIGRAP